MSLPAALRMPPPAIVAPDPAPRARVRAECGDLPFLIRTDGTWLYRGSPIGRKEMVCLFGSVLMRDAEGTFWLETPAERGRIIVQDAPFVAVELDWTGTGRAQALTFRTNVDQLVTAGPANPIRISHDLVTCAPTPYLRIRPGAGRHPIEARISRAVYYEPVALAEPGVVTANGVPQRQALGVWSGGVFFPLGDLPGGWRRRVTAPDESLSLDDMAVPVTGPIVPAAVLVALVQRAGLSGAPGVLLTRRADHLSRHAGQVSFPGGRIDPDDASPEAAALREAQEEVGLDPALVRLDGRLPEHLTGTGYRVVPVLGHVDILPTLKLDPREATAAFLLPVSVLLDPAAPVRRAARGMLRTTWTWPHAEHDIWGATATILLALARRLRAEAG